MYACIKSGNNYIAKDLEGMTNREIVEYIDDLSSSNAIVIVQDFIDITDIDKEFDEDNVIHSDES